MVKYIDKDTLVEEIKNRRDSFYSLSKKGTPAKAGFYAQAQTLEGILSFLDTLEVKEVDLEKEIKEEYLKHRRYGVRDNMLVILNEPQFNKVTKHFFELGLNSKSADMRHVFCTVMTKDNGNRGTDD